MQDKILATLEALRYEVREELQKSPLFQSLIAIERSIAEIRIAYGEASGEELAALTDGAEISRIVTAAGGGTTVAAMAATLEKAGKKKKKKKKRKFDGSEADGVDFEAVVATADGGGRVHADPLSAIAETAKDDGDVDLEGDVEIDIFEEVEVATEADVDGETHLEADVELDAEDEADSGDDDEEDDDEDEEGDADADVEPDDGDEGADGDDDELDDDGDIDGKDVSPDDADDGGADDGSDEEDAEADDEAANAAGEDAGDADVTAADVVESATVRDDSEAELAAREAEAIAHAEAHARFLAESMSAGATDVDAEVVEAIDATAEADAVESPPAGTEAEVDEVAEVVEVAEVEEPAIETEVVGQTEVVEVDEVTEANETVSAATGTVGEVAELDAPESEEPAIETEMPTDTVDEVEIVEIEEAAEAEVGVPAVEAETAIATEMPIETVSEMEVVEIDETVPAATDTVGEMQAVEIEEVDEPQVEEPVTETEVVNEAEVVDLDDVAAAGDQATAIETVSEVEVVEAVEAAEVEEPVTGTGAVGEPVAATRPMARTVGYLPTRPQPNSTFFFASADLYRQPLPKAVDLRPLLAPIIHQGAVAVADAVAAAVDALAGTVGLSGAASRRFIDFNTRLRMGTTNPTVPLSIQAALEAVVRFGASSEAICPWEPDRLGERPAAEAYTAPVPLAFSGLQQVPLNLNAWRQALAEGKVIVFGMAFVEDPDACTTLGGVVPMVTVDAAQTASVQAVQAFACVGYNDTEKVFIIRNCWGEAWGDGGYAYLPYNMVMCKKFVDSDCWVLVPAQPPPLPKARWSDGSTLVTDGGNGIGVETNPIDAAAYWAVSRNFVRDSMVAYIPATPDFARV